MNKPGPSRAASPTRDSRYHHGDLRSALLEAALAVIDEIGPRALTIREVARRAGVSHAAPYRHFRNRDALIEGVVEQGFGLMRQAMLEHMASAPAGPASQFAASGSAYVEFALAHPSHYRVLFGGNLLSRETSQHRASDAVLDALTASMRECQALGIVRPGDPANLAVTIWSLIHGFVSLLIDGRLDHLLGQGRDLKGVRDSVLGAIFQGIGSTALQQSGTIASQPARSPGRKSANRKENNK